jgi:hypothetical protein
MKRSDGTFLNEDLRNYQVFKVDDNSAQCALKVDSHIARSLHDCCATFVVQLYNDRKDCCNTVLQLSYNCITTVARRRPTVARQL